METITKKSAFEVEITTVEPEQVIPEKVTKRVATLGDLKSELANHTENLNKWTVYKTGYLKELQDIDNQIAEHTEKVNNVLALIAEAEAQGVVDAKIQPVEVVKEEVVPVKEVVEEVKPALEEESPV